MNNVITHAFYLFPWSVWVCILKFCSKHIGSLTNYFNILYHSIIHHVIINKILICLTCYITVHPFYSCKYVL